MSLKVGLEYNSKIGGIFSYSGFYSPVFIKTNELASETKIFAHHGEKNEIVTYKEAEHSYKMLKRDILIHSEPDLGLGIDD